MQDFFVDETVLLCYCISKVAKGLFFLREKSGYMACKRLLPAGSEATAPGRTVWRLAQDSNKQRILLEVRHAYKNYIIMH